MSDLILREFNGKSIRHRADGFMSLTDMCDANGKLFADWNRLKATKEYLKALQNKHYVNSHNGPIESKVGGTPEATGTWGDRRVAMRLAQWLSPEFAVQVDEWAVELMSKGTVSIVEPIEEHTYVRQLSPQRDLADYMTLAIQVGIDQDPLLKSLFSQRMAEQLGGNAKKQESDQCILTVRATELGVSQKDLGDGSQLGKYIVAMGFKPTGKTQHGKYPCNVYQKSGELDEAILYFCGRSSGLAVAS